MISTYHPDVLPLLDVLGYPDEGQGDFPASEVVAYDGHPFGHVGESPVPPIASSPQSG